jgi:adenosylmethionine-8-amino-7-oxononanoate aminotransferase
MSVAPAPPSSAPAALTPGADLAARDLRVVWHPCTQMKDHEWLPMLPIARGEGVWLYDHDGRRYLDAISSWWVNLFGHANPRINAALAAQLGRLEHVILAGCTHEPAVRLAERLTALAPPGLTRCFYADNGSSAIEVALKMSFHAWRNAGFAAKRRFVTLAGSYHGETLGALAVGDVELYKDIYRPLLMEVLTAPTPDAWLREPGETDEACAGRAVAAMDELLGRHAAETCAVIVEPLVQCAAGMRVHAPAYLHGLRELCDRHGVHLIADEIAVGFGRTGTMFACEQAGISPDFLCLSKGITGGYLPLSVVLTGQAVYDAFYAEYSQLRAFLHSHSYTGNALACTAALATLDIFESDDVLARNRALAVHLGARARDLLGDLPHVAEVRQCGMIVAAELARDGNRATPFDWRERRGLRVYRHGLAHEALLRPLGNVVYFMPPYVITPQEIDALVATARDGIALATDTRASVAVAERRASQAPDTSITGLEF